MDAKKKIVELIAQKVCDTWSERCDEWLPRDCGKCYANDCHISELADHLIANGVTVQEWVSVEDRLPEENTTVIVATDNGIVFQCLYSYDGWDLWDDNDVNITHLQPMPQPPKGE